MSQPTRRRPAQRDGLKRLCAARIGTAEPTVGSRSRRWALSVTGIRSSRCAACTVRPAATGSPVRVADEQPRPTGDERCSCPMSRRPVEDVVVSAGTAPSSSRYAAPDPGRSSATVVSQDSGKAGRRSSRTSISRKTVASPAAVLRKQEADSHGERGAGGEDHGDPAEAGAPCSQGQPEARERGPGCKAGGDGQDDTGGRRDANWDDGPRDQQDHPARCPLQCRRDGPRRVDGTGQHCQMAQVRLARRKGVREEPTAERPSREPPARTWRSGLGSSAHLCGSAVGGTSGSGDVADREATVKACGVTVAMLQGHSWAPTSSNGSTVNVGTIPAVPSPASGLLVGGKARRRLMPPGWGGGPVVVRGRESRPHGEGVQRVRSVQADRGVRR